MLEFLFYRIDAVHQFDSKLHGVSARHLQSDIWETAERKLSFDLKMDVSSV